MTEQELDQALEKLARAGTFEPKKMTKMEKWAGRVAQGLFLKQDIDWKVCTEQVGEATIIRIDDEWLNRRHVRFLACMPHGTYDGQICDQFVWAKDYDFKDSLDPELVSIFLMQKQFPGIKVEHVKDKSGNKITVLRLPTGQTVTAHFPPEMFEDKTWAPKTTNLQHDS